MLSDSYSLDDRVLTIRARDLISFITHLQNRELFNNSLLELIYFLNKIKIKYKNKNGRLYLTRLNTMAYQSLTVAHIIYLVFIMLLLNINIKGFS